MAFFFIYTNGSGFFHYIHKQEWLFSLYTQKTGALSEKHRVSLLYSSLIFSIWTYKTSYPRYPDVRYSVHSTERTNLYNQEQYFPQSMVARGEIHEFPGAYFYSKMVFSATFTFPHVNLLMTGLQINLKT
jgi:hypothetical protein